MIEFLVVALVRVLLGPSVRYLEPLPDGRPVIFYANHSSHLDFLVVWTSLPARLRRLARPVAAEDYWSRGIRRFLAARVFGAVLIERHHPTPEHNPIADMLAAMDAGYSLILFPEGTRGPGEEVQSFQPGLFHLLRDRPLAAAIPVYLENLNRILPKGEVLPVPLLSRVVFGAPVSMLEREERRDFLERARTALVELKDA